MNDFFNELIEGKIDFEGQKLVENITKIALTVICIVSFVLGFGLQSLKVTFGALSLGSLVVFLVVVPQWPAYTRHPVQWLPVKQPTKLS
ncbi:hypothetical protein JAAARDRAFT_200582 [Jaapia argillacea MUCL 33604]|uniref:Signal peptidase complex subunit 1 n=1 Tax=Jaapia argillacea MUCL 33604 TaxID=933084 RepID=A0A067P7E1_9AGAM|nr:hypothetical protein JAAARDRAFT_200582 [Jaapia argillacea MUCL 33604]